MQLPPAEFGVWMVGDAHRSWSWSWLELGVRQGLGQPQPQLSRHDLQYYTPSSSLWTWRPTYSTVTLDGHISRVASRKKQVPLHLWSIIKPVSCQVFLDF